MTSVPVSVPVTIAPNPRAHARPTLITDPAVTTARKAARAFEISLARTKWNYTRTYLEPLPFSADVPDGESFTLAYEGLLVEPLKELAENFAIVVMDKLEEELAGDLDPTEGFAAVKTVEAAYEKLVEQLDGLSAINVVKDLDAIVEFAGALAKLPRAIESYTASLERLPEDLKNVAKTLSELPAEFERQGVTAFLRDTLYDLLRNTRLGANYLQPKSLEDYELLYSKLPQPKSKVLPRADWMPEGRPYQHDWYFGWMQIAGFNTTQLRRVTGAGEQAASALSLDALLKKMPITDALFAAVIGEGAPTLADAASAGHLYVVDFPMFHNIQTDVLHGEQRYMTAPIALFYWNTSAPEGYPPAAICPEGVMQPVAIQLAQFHDPESAPIFTPKGNSDAHNITQVKDPGGLKWQVAKWQVLHACAVQHETVAHLGDCHLVIEPLVVAMYRTLPEEHPIHALLKPHFRFTIAINHAAMHSLIIPGGVVASVLSTSINASMGLVRDAHLAYRFDERNPKNLFKGRGVDSSKLPDYPMRDDTMLLYDSIEQWVRDYLAVYYADDATVLADTELQDFIHELAAPNRVAMRGMNGLEKVTVGKTETHRVTNLDYLGQVIAQIIYTASAQHASVNYAQYPLMSYLPSVSGTAYAPAPGRDGIFTEDQVLAMLPPIDVALYQLSFGYLLSSVQYDRLGVYTDNPRRPYFQDPRVHAARDRFQAELAQAEAVIRGANLTRPVPFETQIPSYVPNSISI